MKRLNLFHVIIQFVIILIFLLSVVTSSSAAPEADPGINNVYISKVSDNDFIVSWTTDVASDGTVSYGTSTPPTTDKSDDITSTTTHYVRITGLSAETTYYVSVTSDTATDDNGGLYYEITTGPQLGPVGSALVYGTLYESNGTTPVPNGVVYIQLQDTNGTGNGNSQWVATRSDINGEWSYSLPATRTSDLTEYFNYTSGEDNLRLNFQCGDKGNVGEDGSEYIVSIPSSFPADLGSVNCDDVPNAIEISEFVARNWSDSGFLLLAAISGTVIAALLFFGRRVRN